jgi:hypothetical protein
MAFLRAAEEASKTADAGHGTMPGNEDHLARAERHLREGEVCVARLERLFIEMKRANHPEAERMATTILVPFQLGVARFRERLGGLREERRPLDPR